ncbi:hypothetical protein [Methylomonas methanica]|uniref:hypothetical protein n=1 Tax=Methylomonas methanica TaxID=421 RepID=UPI000B032C47|nr:hypothetical protein [Methylomonas methanica]
MLIKIWRFLTILLVALLLGLAFAHVLERPAKMLYDAALYLTIQKTLYFAWGPPHIGGILEPAAILLPRLCSRFSCAKQNARFGSPSAQAAHCCLRFRSYFSFLWRQQMQSFS